MSDPYSYDYDDDINPYVNDGTANMDDVDIDSTSAPPRNLPPPPTVKANAPVTQQTSSITINKPDPTTTPKEKKKKDLPNTTDLTGFRQKKLFGFAYVGNLPFPLINPNYFTYVRWSGHWIIVPVAFFELFLVILVLLLNIISQWLFLGASIQTNVSWPPYVALRLVWAHVVLCLVPWVVFSKYAAIFKACTEVNPMVKAPLYLMFVIFSILSTIFYLAMWTGGVGSGLFSSIFFLIAGLANGPAWYTVIFAIIEFVLSFGWVLLMLCSFIEIGGMARNYYLYKKARKEAKAAINAV